MIEYYSEDWALLQSMEGDSRPINRDGTLVAGSSTKRRGLTSASVGQCPQYVRSELANHLSSAVNVFQTRGTAFAMQQAPPCCKGHTKHSWKPLVQQWILDSVPSLPPSPTPLSIAADPLQVTVNTVVSCPAALAVDTNVVQSMGQSFERELQSYAVA